MPFKTTVPEGAEKTPPVLLMLPEMVVVLVGLKLPPERFKLPVMLTVPEPPTKLPDDWVKAARKFWVVEEAK